jgi:hypothetical protein
MSRGLGKCHSSRSNILAFLGGGLEDSERTMLVCSQKNLTAGLNVREKTVRMSKKIKKSV